MRAATDRPKLSQDGSLRFVTASSQQPRGETGTSGLCALTGVSLLIEHLRHAKIMQRSSISPNRERTCNPSPHHQPLSGTRDGGRLLQAQKARWCPVRARLFRRCGFISPGWGSPALHAGVTGSPFLEDRLAEARSKLYPSVQTPEPLGSLRLLPNN